MKKFDLEAALDGAPCRTRSGRKAFVRHYECGMHSVQVLLGIVQSSTGSEGYEPMMWHVGGRVFLNQSKVLLNHQDIIGMWEPEFQHWDLFDPSIIRLEVGTSRVSDSGLCLYARNAANRQYLVHMAAHLITDPVGTVYTR